MLLRALTSTFSLREASLLDNGSGKLSSCVSIRASSIIVTCKSSRVRKPNVLFAANMIER